VSEFKKNYGGHQPHYSYIQHHDLSL
jgi:hypothetical protein